MYAISICLSLHPSIIYHGCMIQPLMHTCMHYPLTYPFTHASVHPSTHQGYNRSLPPTHLFIHISTHTRHVLFRGPWPHIHPSTHLITHLQVIIHLPGSLTPKESHSQISVSSWSSFIQCAFLHTGQVNQVMVFPCHFRPPFLYADSMKG